MLNFELEAVSQDKRMLTKLFEIAFLHSKEGSVHNVTTHWLELTILKRHSLVLLTPANGMGNIKQFPGPLHYTQAVEMAEAWLDAVVEPPRPDVEAGHIVSLGFRIVAGRNLDAVVQNSILALAPEWIIRKK